MNEVVSKNKLWSDDELQAALDAYLYMLQLEISSIPFSVVQYSELLRSGFLHKRNEASIRYRMRNISHVVAERGLPTLSAYSAAPQVGRNVMRKLNAFLDSRIETVRNILHSGPPKAGEVGLSDVLQSLSELKDRVSALEEVSAAGIGHNNPPDSIHFEAKELANVTAAIDGISQEVTQTPTDSEVVRTLSQQVLAFGFKVAVWCGQRLNDYAKASVSAAGTVSGALLLVGLSEHIISALGRLFQLIF